MEEQKKKVKAIIADALSVKFEEVTEEKTLQDLGADSLDAVEVMMNLEQGFGVTITDDEMEGVKTVGEAIAMISKKIKTNQDE